MIGNLRILKQFSPFLWPQQSRIISPRLLSFRRNQTALEFEQFERSDFRSGPNDFGERKPRLTDQQIYLQEKLMNGVKSYKKYEWDEIMSRTIEIPSYIAFVITPITLTGTIVNFCKQENNFLLGLNFMEYLESKGEEINTGTINAFLKLCTAAWPESSEEAICKYYDILRKRLPVMDATTAETLIYSLCLTSRWEECIDLLDTIKLSDRINVKVYCTLAIAAFKNKEIEMGWSWLREAAGTGSDLIVDSYSTWFQFCSENEPTAQNGEKLLTFLNEYNMAIGVDTAEDIKQYFELVVKPLWNIKETTVKSQYENNYFN